MLFTAGTGTAAEARAYGMVNHVVSRGTLEGFTLALAEKISTKPSFALKMAKDSVNASIDSQGQTDAIDKAFLYHHLCSAVGRPDGRRRKMTSLLRSAIAARTASV